MGTGATWHRRRRPLWKARRSTAQPTSSSGSKAGGRSGRGIADQPRKGLAGRRIEPVRADKRRLFLVLEPLYVVVLFLGDGSYRPTEVSDLEERLVLGRPVDTLDVYSCSVTGLEDGDPALEKYGRSTEEVPSESSEAERPTETPPRTDRPVADVLVDGPVFRGVGNIVRIEVRWVEGLHPRTSGTCSTTGRPPGRLRQRSTGTPTGTGPSAKAVSRAAGLPVRHGSGLWRRPRARGARGVSGPHWCTECEGASPSVG